MKPLNILVTRPKKQAEDLCQAISAIGHAAIAFPVIEIQPVQHSHSLLKNWNYDFIIFTSSNAVEYSKTFLPEKNTLKAKVAAIGDVTAKALTTVGYSVDVVPQEFNSESLVESLNKFSLAGKKILIVTGVGGRRFLETQLKKQKAIVDRLEVYRRIKPDKQLTKDLLETIDIAILTSCESVQNLCKMTPEGLRSLLFNIKLLVVSPRILSEAKRAGFKQFLLAKNANSETIIETLKEESNV